MNLMKVIREKLCRQLPVDEKVEVLPPKISQQSHGIANRAAEVQAVSQRIHRDVEALSRLAALVKDFREDDEDDPKHRAAGNS